MSSPSLRAVDSLSSEMTAFIHMLREHLRDYPELNRLITGVETSDRMLLHAAGKALVRYNGTPPMSQLSLSQVFGLQHQDLLLDMAVINVLESVMLLQARNQLNYSTGGTTVGVNDKAVLLLKILQYLRATVDQDLKVRKVAVNILSILGDMGVSSEYALVHSSYVFW